MLFEKRYKSKLGYSVGEDDEIDSYGVDHSGFTTRDEVAYQTARNDRENDLIENYNKRGITDNYPQYGRNFWGGSPANNYGFGSSNITDNIETVKNRFGNAIADGDVDSFSADNSGGNFGVYNRHNGWNYYIDTQKRQTLVPSEMQCTPERSKKFANITSIYPDYSQPSSLEFDGQHLVWLENGKPVKYYPAMSGKSDHQTAQDTNLPNKGPIPEGDYMLAQGSGEDYNNKEEMSWWKSMNPWKNKRWYEKPDSWGYSRIPIRPMAGTNTYGRHSMYVHGGTAPGSAGCIDLTGRNDDFYNDFKNYNGDIELKVKYPKGW